MQCPFCNKENAEGEVLCRYCSLPLTPEGATRQLNSDEETVTQARWGTTRLGTDRKLLLHIRGHVKPLVVSVMEEAMIGRVDPDTGEAPEIPLDEYQALELGVSRRHAVIFVEDDALKLEDLGSANFSYINGQKLIANQPRILRDGDELRFGQLVMRVHFA